MHRAVEMVGGGILGFVAGSFLCVPLIAHVFGPTTVTWDASACPSGIYTITSTATNIETGRTYTTTTAHLRLPKGSLVQEFSDLPVGQYQVTAVARDARGRIFNSDSQSVSGQGMARGQQAAMRVQTAAQTAAASALARPTPIRITAAPASKPADSSSASIDENVVPASSTAAESARPIRLSRGMVELLTGTPGTEPGLLALFPEWKSIVFIDNDNDGVADMARIEFVSGEVWIAYLANQ